MKTGTAKHAGILWSIALLASIFMLIASVVGPRPAFAALCHQIPSRSFVVGDHLFAVCHRCTGIYTGIVFGLLIGLLPSVQSLISSYGRSLIVIAVSAVTLDVLVDLSGIVSTSPGSRVLTGFLLGATGSAFLGAAIWQMASGRWQMASSKQRSK